MISRGRVVATVVGWLALVACSDTGETSGLFAHDTIARRAPENPWGKTTGDLNGDGHDDVVIGGNGGDLVWYEGPTWRRHVIVKGGGFSTDHAIGDIDGDGAADLVSLRHDSLVWFRNGEWQETVIERRKLHDVELADLDGDGHLDIVVRGQTAFGSGDGIIDVHYQREHAWETHRVQGPPGEGLALLDMDRDGRPDIVLNGKWLRNPGAADSMWRSATFAPNWTWPHTTIATGDINADGRPDIVLTPAEPAGQVYHLSWFESPSDVRAPWTEHLVADDLETVHHSAVIADFNRDGHVDIATAAMQQGRTPTEVKVYLQDGQGVWHKEVIGAGGSHGLRALDADGDGDVDLAGANWDGPDQRVELWRNRSCSMERPCR